MRTPAKLEIKIGGKVHLGWRTYDIDSDLFIPADAWWVRLSKERLKVPAEVKEGAQVEVRLTRDGKQTQVLSGVLEQRSHKAARDGSDLTLTGRDGAGVLLDCSAPILSMRQMSLDDVVTRVVRPLGVTRIRIDADSSLRREKVNSEPGDTAWDTLRRAAEANGLWPWFEPDGTLVVGGPRYDTPPVSTLVMTHSGEGNNVHEIEEVRSINDRYSEVTVLGQAHAYGSGGGEQVGRNDVKAVERDDGVTLYRPKIVVDHEAINETIARARGRKIISDARLRAFSLMAVVPGHYAENGEVWTPGQRVAVKSEPHDIDGVYFLTARRLSCNRYSGQVTMLTLKEDGVWVLDAHPAKRKHRRGKNSMPGRIVDLQPGSGL